MSFYLCFRKVWTYIRIVEGRNSQVGRMNANSDIWERLSACDKRLRAYDDLLADERALVKGVLSIPPEQRAANRCYRRLLELTQRVTNSGRETIMTALLECAALRIDEETAAMVEMAVRQRDAFREETAAMLGAAWAREQ
jgi:hypothetical protein